MEINIGTRNSKLAIRQTEIVISKLPSNVIYNIVPIVTSGDKFLDVKLYDIGGKALFLKELEEALLAKKIDVAVHSLKDVPAFLPSNFELISYLNREDASDSFISCKYKNIKEIQNKTNITIGTSSLRREVFLKKYNPNINIISIRGNIHTRIQKLQENQDIDAIILATAGLRRSSLLNKNIYYSKINKDIMLPAVGQGVIAIEALKNNDKIKEIFLQINCSNTQELVNIERCFFQEMNASCNVAIAANATYVENKIIANYMAQINGKIILHQEIFPQNLPSEEIKNITKNIVNKYFVFTIK